MYTTAKHLSLTLKTPLGEDALILDRLRVVEQASTPFVMTLEMHALDSSLDIESLVGKMISIEFSYNDTTRNFNGIVGEIEQGMTRINEVLDQTRYTARVYPELWLLKFSQDHQIFQNMSALDIIKKVLQENGVTDIEDRTSRVCIPREYCVQYRESYFNFVCRLMEEEGIYYSFDHTGTQATLVLGDPTKPPLPCYTEDLRITQEDNIEDLFDEIQSLNYTQQVVAKEYSAADYNFKTASTKLYDKAPGEGDGLSVYRYPGLFKNRGEGEAVGKLRIQELEWYKKTISGMSSSPQLTPMATFGIKEHLRDDLNRKYIVYKVIHDINVLAAPDCPVYQNEFVAFPDDVPFHPPLISPKPIMASTQTAVVTGKPGEEIWCDEYGRIKVHFYWDQKGKMDDKSSCWIRVAQLWAGSNWGGLWTPRVGMEVVVTFLEGDPDKPLITGCVYNSDNMPMYAAKEPTKSTIKSNTTKGGHGYNEFRFEDKKQAEEIFIHAQKDMNTVVEENRTLKINDIDDQTDIYCGDRRVILHGDNGAKKKNGGHDTLTLLKGNRKVELSGKGPATGNHTLIIHKGDDTIHIMKGNMKIKLDLGNYNLDVMGIMNINVTGGVSISGGGDISLKAAGAISINAGGAVAIKGAVVKIN